MSDAAIVALALAVLGAARLALPVPVAVVGVVTAVAVVSRRPLLLCAALALLSTTWASRAWDGLDPVDAHSFTGPVTLLGDPVADGAGLRVDARAEGRRVEVRARRAVATTLDDALAGDVVFVDGRFEPFARRRSRHVVRHLVGVLHLHRVHHVRPASGVAAGANGLRRLLERGALPLPERQRTLYTGMVYGDDRDQPLDVADAFRGAGLTHLLAVSGQNVAFALVLCGPLLRRLRLTGRLVSTFAVLVLFGIVTRFEPSVLRAVAMASVAAFAVAVGRPASSLRVLGLGVVALVFVDPLVVHSLGFRLSLAATAAIVVVAPTIAARLPGPRAVADTLAITLAAQAGVAPIQLLAFGSIPLAALPANVLVTPLAGPLMMWGLTAGLVAGIVGPAAAVLQAPSRLALSWIDGTAERLAMAGVGELRANHAIAIAVACVTAFAWRHHAVRVAAIVVVVAAVLLASRPSTTVDGMTRVERGAELWSGREGRVLVVSSRSYAPDVVEALRRRHVRRLDAVAFVATPDADLATALSRRYGAAIYASVSTGPPGVATVVPSGATVVIGDLEIRSREGELAVSPRAPARIRRTSASR